MKKTGMLILIALLLLAGCGPKTDPAPAGPTAAPTGQPTAAVPPFALSEGFFAKVDGSTANIPLAEAVTGFFLQKSPAECEEYIRFSGTSMAYERLISRAADLLIVYEPAELTKEVIDDSAVAIQAKPIGRDALVFLIHKDNGVDNLTADQIRDIYAGKIDNWKQVGGADQAIKAFQRNATAGSQAMMDKLVMKGRPMMTPPQDWVIGDMGGLLTAVAVYDGQAMSLGYNVYYYVTEMMANPDIKILQVDGIMPGHETIAKGQYPFVNDFFAVIRQDEPKDSEAYRLFTWLQGAEGQKLIFDSGYVTAGE